MRSLSGLFKSAIDQFARTEPKKILRLGLDYGTSASKLVIRDDNAPGGARAYVVGRPGGGYRFPSAIYHVPSERHLVLGVKPAAKKDVVAYHSVKMRVAEDAVGGAAQFFYGKRIDYPTGWSSKGLAVLSVWYLLSEALRWARSAFPRHDELLISTTMGIPMSFHDTPAIKQAFLDVIRAAQRLHKKNGSMPGPEIDSAMALALAKDALDEVDGEPIEMSRHRAWIRSEAESALFWAFRSPSVPPGLYAKVDVGAGTTNCSTFIMEECFDENAGRWRKDKVGFFSALSGCLGTDAIHEQMLKVLPQVESFEDVRGRENELLAQCGNREIDSVIKRIYMEIHQKNWQKARNLYPSEAAWKIFTIIVIGGGGQIGKLRDAFKDHPSLNWRQWADRRPQLNIMALSMPEDLYMGDRRGRPENRDLPFLLVAYGLSNSEFSVPQVTSPQEMKPIPVCGPTLRYIEDADAIR